MSVRVQRRRGTAAAHATFIGAEGEFTYQTDTKRVVAHDGATVGGIPMARLDEISEDTYREFGNANVTVQISDGRLALNAALTAARSVTLPAADDVPPGKTIRISDKVGGINGANVLNLTRAGSDTINGGAGPFVMRSARGQWEITSDGASNWTVLAALPESGRGQVAALILSNNASNPTNGIDISQGTCRDSSDSFYMTLPSTLTKHLGANWALGSGNGGLDTGTKANDASYHMHIIRRDSDGLLDAIFSASATAPSRPVGWSKSRRIGSVTTDGSGVIRPFLQVENEFWYKGNVIANAALATSTTPVLQVLPVPAGIKCKARLAALASGGAAGLVLMRDPDLGVPTVDPNFGDWRRDGVNNLGFIHEVWTNTARQIYCGDSGSGGGTLNIRVRGWVDNRDEFA